MAEDNGALTSLNDQLLASIFFHVCPKDVASVRAVSKEWEKLVDEAQVVTCLTDWMGALQKLA